MAETYVPIHFLKNLVDLIADEEGYHRSHVLRGTGITVSEIMDEGGLATFAQSTAVYERVAELSTLPGIGFRSPSASSFADQGVLGAMLITAPTVGVAFQKLSEFIDVIGGTVDYGYRIENDNFVVTCTDKDSYSPSAHMLITEENLAVWKFISLPIAHLDSYLKEIRVDYPRPKHWRMYVDLFPECEIRFKQTEVAAVLSRDVVDMPIQTNNPKAHKNLEQACEELMSRINPSMYSRVVEFLNKAKPCEWSVSNIADGLNTTQKTLRRRLGREGHSARDMLTAHKKHYSMELLAKGDDDKRVAATLGYSDRTSFARSFKQWTGLTPSLYRRRHCR